MDEPTTEDYRTRVLIVDNGVRLLCQTQQPAGVEDAGGFKCPERLCCEPWFAAHALRTLWRVYREPLSQFYHLPALPERMRAALDFLRASQYANGTIDAYFAGDMQAAPNVAFVAGFLCPLYTEMAEATGPEALSAAFLESLREFLVGCGRALIRRPVFTPNHRWVAVTALLRLHALFPDPALAARAERYLAEGIDINADGMYSERSASYAFVTNESLLPVAELTGDAAYYDLIRRSLDFLLHNAQENGEAIYQYSLRQDAVTPKARLGGAAVWAAMARRDRNGQYAQMADWTGGNGTLTLVEAARRNQAEIESWRPAYDNDEVHPSNLKGSLMSSLSRRGEMLDPGTAVPGDIPREPLPTRYHKTYTESRLVRARDGKRSVTLMAMQPNFLTLHNRGVVLEGLRISYNYHGWKQVMPRGFDGFGQYLYRFRDSYRDRRDTTVAVDEDLTFTVTAEVRADDVSLVIDVEGQARVPVQIEMAWRPEGTLDTIDRHHYELSQTRRAILTDQELTVRHGADQIHVAGLPPMTQRYFDDTQPWMPHIPVVRVLSPFFSPASVRLELTLL